jgi:hypothetical protein
MTQLGHEYLICCNAIPAYIASRDAQPGGDNVTGKAATWPINLSPQCGRFAADAKH